ncbi:MAG: hypothetical protein RL621_33 [Bacteroidota bacterium]|jgi:hypothetical protein
MKELEESKLRFFITTFAARVHNLARRYGTFRISTKDLSLFETCFLLNKDFNYSYRNNINYALQHKNLLHQFIDKDQIIQYTNTITRSNPVDVMQILNELFKDENEVRTAKISIHFVNYDLSSCNFQVDILGDINNSRIIQYMMNEGNTVKYSSAESETLDWDNVIHGLSDFPTVIKNTTYS